MTLQSVMKKGCKFLEGNIHPSIGVQFRISRNADMSHATDHPELEIFSNAFIYDILRDVPDLHRDVLQILDAFMDSEELDDEIKTYAPYRLPRHFPYACNTSLEPSDVDTMAVRVWGNLRSELLDMNDESDLARTFGFANKLGSNHYVSNGLIAKFFLSNVDDDGKVDVKKGLDVGVMANVMRILHKLKYDKDSIKTEDYLLEWLQKESKMRHTYYWSRDMPTYLISNSLLVSERIKEKFTKVIKQRLLNRVGSTESGLDIALRILIANNLGIIPNKDGKNKVKSQKTKLIFEGLKLEVEKLIQLQRNDGSWIAEPILINRLGYYLGSEVHSTSFVLKALEAIKHLDFQLN